MSDWLQTSITTIAAGTATALAASASYWMVRLTGSALAKRTQDANAMVSFLEKWIAVSRSLGPNEGADQLARQHLAEVLDSVWSEYQVAISEPEFTRKNPLRSALVLYPPKHSWTWVLQTMFYLAGIVLAIAIYRVLNHQMPAGTGYVPVLALLSVLLFRALVFFADQRR
jgi:hypothetical protein